MGGKKVWSIELNPEDRLEDQQRHGYRVWKWICQYLTLLLDIIVHSI